MRLVDLTAIFFLVIFNIFNFNENKIMSSKLMCYYFKQVFKNIDID